MAGKFPRYKEIIVLTCVYRVRDTNISTLYTHNTDCCTTYWRKILSFPFSFLTQMTTLHIIIAVSNHMVHCYLIDLVWYVNLILISDQPVCGGMELYLTSPDDHIAYPALLYWGEGRLIVWRFILNTIHWSWPHYESIYLFLLT